MQRVERAKHLIDASERSLSEISLETGFSDQSHLTRVFSRHVERSPATWRRFLRCAHIFEREFTSSELKLCISETRAAV